MAMLSAVNAQPISNHFEHLSVKDGLSHNSVNCILQDREGFMWFATNDGLNKYDGYTFTVLQPDPDRPGRSFQDNRVTALCEDRVNRLWATTESGLHEVNKQTGQVTPHLIEAKQASRWNLQWSVYEDRQGKLWVSSYNGLIQYNPDQHRFRLYPTPLWDMKVKNVLEDRLGRFWVVTSLGLYQFDQQTGQYTRLTYRTITGEQPSFDYSYLDGQDRLWLSSIGSGLFLLDLRSQPLTIVPFNPKGQINRFLFLNALHGDAQANLWVGTTEGLQYIDPARQQVTTYRPDSQIPDGISSVYAQAVYHDRAGTLWVGTNNGVDKQTANAKPFVTYQIKPTVATANFLENRASALLIDSRKQTWVCDVHHLYRLSSPQSPPALIPPKLLGSTNTYVNYIFNFLPNGPAGIWIGTWDGLYKYEQASDRYTLYRSEIPVTDLSWGPTGDIWFGGEGGFASFNPKTNRYTYYKYNPLDTTGLRDKFVRAILASRTGNIWVAVNGKGISQFNPRTGAYTHYVADGRAGQLSNSEVLHLYEDPAGLIWAGTNRDGLNCLDPKTGNVSTVTTRDGLPSNRVTSIIGDKVGYLWLGTDKGLCRYDPRTRAVRIYTVSDGLPNNDFQENAVWRQQNHLYFGTLSGFIHFNPDRIRNNIRPFPVYITDFTVHNQPRSLTGVPLELQHDENELSFGFVALTYRLPERSRYAYQLVGVDKQWVQSGNRRFASYTNLAPGEYVFRVRASNSDGVWNNRDCSVQFTILPPWWATWWAYGLYVLIIGSAVTGYMRFYANRIRQRQALELNQRQAQQLRIVEEMKSRFFTNVTHEFRTPLTLILSPVDSLLNELENTPYAKRLAGINRNARQLLNLINQLMDLSKIESHVMPVEESRGELNTFVEQLVHLFQETTDRVGPQLTYHSDVTGTYWFDADKLERIVNNLVSNAVKFTPDDGRVMISLTTTTPQGIKLTVADTGVGIPTGQQERIFERFYQGDTSSTRTWGGTGIGLALVSELIQLQKGQIEAVSEKDQGTVVTVLLPYQLDQAEDIIGFNPIDQADLLPTDTPEGDQKERPQLLVVEDNSELASFITDCLPERYQIRRAVDGVDGVEQALLHIPDLIISDVLMPRMDGYTLVQTLKADERTSHIPIMLLTAKATLDSRLKGFSLGADAYLTKPFSVTELQLQVHNLLEQRRQWQNWMRNQLASPGEAVLPTASNDPFLNKAYALIDERLEDSGFGVEELAEALGMSRITLHRKIKSLTAYSSTELIRNYRLKRAAQFLKQGHNSSETAYQVGFDSPAYFTKCFRQLYQVTPMEFIRQNRRVE